MKIIALLIVLFTAIALVEGILRLLGEKPEAPRSFKWRRLWHETYGAVLPKASVTLATSGGSAGVQGDLVFILSCTEKGTAAQPGLYANSQAILDTFGWSEGLELAAHDLEQRGTELGFCKIATVTAGSIKNADVKGVTGTSAVTFTGTPFDEEYIFVECVTGGTIATAGIEIRYTRDGGVTWSGNVRLGTATSYVIPNSGITVNFAAGTLVAKDIAKAYCAPPKWDAASLQAAFTALQNSNHSPRLVVVCGDVVNSTELQNVIDAINTYETTGGKHSRVLSSVRDRFFPAAMQGTQTVTTASVGKTYTRSAGSFITDGFQIGGTAVWAGFVNAASNGAKTITALSATVMTVSEAIGADEAAVAGTSATFSELKPAWRTAVEAVVGSTPTTAKVSHRTIFGGGRARRRSPINFFRKSRPCTWPYAMRAMLYDVQISPAKVENGALEGWSIIDEATNLTTTSPTKQIEMHDERVDGGLLAMRVMCLRTFAELSGVFVALPVTLDQDNASLSRAPVGHVADIVCGVAKAELTRKLSSEVVLKDDNTGKMLESERKRIESAVQTQLEIAVLTKRKNGQRASAVQFILDGTADLRIPGVEVTSETRVTPLGTFEQIKNTVRVAFPGG